MRHNRIELSLTTYPEMIALTNFLLIYEIETDDN